MKVNEIILLKFIAIIFITNSHLNGYYPVSYFSTAGSLGNSIFFLISTIGLTFSLDKKVINFSSWYKKRFIRIYPTMWLAITVFILVGLFNFESYYEIVAIYLFPFIFYLYRVATLVATLYLSQDSVLKKVVFFISNITLEIYILQGVIYSNDYLKNIVFPLNIIIFWILVILFAYLLNTISSKLLNWIKNEKTSN
jgi:hypothetical protein